MADPTPSLSVDVTVDGDDLRVRLAGALDAQSAGGLRAAIEAWPIGPTTSVDMSELSFVDSVGVGCLLKLQQRVADAGGVLIARGTRASVRRTLETTGVHRVIALLD